MTKTHEPLLFAQLLIPTTLILLFIIHGLQLHWKYNLKMTLTSCDQFPWYKKIDLYQLTISLVISLQEFLK